MKLRIECAKKEDYPQFKEIHQNVVYLGCTTPRKPDIDQASFNEYVDMESMLVAFEGDVMVGYATVALNWKGTCDIVEIYVHPKYQRKGYGYQIVEKIKKEAKEAGARKLRVASFFIETDNFWMRKCRFMPAASEDEEDRGALVLKI